MLRDYVDSKFQRYTARINSDWNVISLKDRTLLTFGENLMLNYTRTNGLGAIGCRRRMEQSDASGFQGRTDFLML